MNELIAALMTVVLNMSNLPNPEFPPVVRAAGVDQIQKKACENQEVCKDIHVYTDPLEDVIYYDKDIDFSYTLAKSELMYELARYTLYSHGIYRTSNSCERNIEIEKALVRMRFDFIKMEMDQGRYNGYGVPQIQDLPTHVFYCTPKENQLPEISI